MSSSILSTPVLSAKRLDTTPGYKSSKLPLQPSPPPSQDKDTTDQKDQVKGTTPKKQPFAAASASQPAQPEQRTSARPTSASNRPTSASRIAKPVEPRLVKQTTPKGAGVVSPAAAVASRAPQPVAAATTAGRTAAPRAASVVRDRAPPGETRSSILRRSMSVGKGRVLAGSTEPGPQPPAAAPTRPSFVRSSLTASTSSSSLRASVKRTPEKRDPSAGRLRRPVSASRNDGSLLASSKRGLNTIKEAPPRPASATTSGLSKPSTPTRPVPSLNLGALKQQSSLASQPSLSSAVPLPSPPPLLSQTTSLNSAGAPQEEAGPPVPKLNLGGILQRRAEEQAQEPVFVVAASSEPEPAGGASQNSQDKRRASASRLPSAKEEPQEHFYLYPKVAPQEKKRIDDICRVLPKKQQTAVNDLFSKMVEARQNCEQMCFRGHRLLDQAQSEFRNRLAAKEEEVARKEEEVARKEEEADQWRQEAEYLRTQLERLLGAQQADSAQAMSPMQDGPVDTAESGMRDSVLVSFDRMAQLGAQQAAAQAEMEAEAEGAGPPAEIGGSDGNADGGSNCPVDAAQVE
ncbi:hypothetical protein HXX76_008637 [Chlamydomonas incerta]|uniref:Uncharacterized protein n=1 Tax=Chlamydomonas incerta TaxID=51695 RepID=A0A835ST71_CHLIN|nr:hypothetical protein HXX76_008637 [Chlamydomonas incerta]|eukprot:KAG2432907.1 hypothetical protein HXX76_008637 [Chlamydomonas incerta]